MSWDFETEPEYQAKLDRAGASVREEVVARPVLRDHTPSDDRWPTGHLPEEIDAAMARFAEHLEHEVGNR